MEMADDDERLIEMAACDCKEIAVNDGKANLNIQMHYLTPSLNSVMEQKTTIKISVFLTE